MIAATTFATRKVALFGLGGSGLATAHALKAGGADVAVWDDSAASREKAGAEGLAPVDLSLDSTLRPGDIVATSSGLVAYSGINATSQTAQFTPVNNYPGLTADLRARLGEMKVAPVTADLPEDTYSSQDVTGSVPEPRYAQPMAPDATLPKIATPKPRRMM